MKKTLFMMAAALLMTVQVSAQLQPKRTMQHLQGQPQVMHRVSPKTQMQQASVAPVTKAQVPQQATKQLPPLAGYANGMYYARPEGTFYQTFQASSNGKYYGYVLAPNFTELKWRNMTDEANKANTTWYINDNAVEGDENNDYIAQYFVRSGYLSYVPTLHQGLQTFTLGDDVATPYEQVGVIPTDSIYNLLKWDITQGGNYTGYNDGSYGYGTGTTTFDFDGDGEAEEVFSDGIVEFFDKPATPLYLSSIYFPVTSNQTEQEKMFADGKELTVEIFKVITNEDGSRTLDEEPLATMKATELQNFGNYSSGDGSHGYFEVSQVEVDAFGTEYSVPVILDDAFAVVITGFAQEGVDLGLRFGNAAAAAYDYPILTPTFERYYDVATGEYKGMLRTYGKSSSTGALYCYNAAIYLEGMWDAVYVDDTMLDYTIPVEGGTMESVNEFTNSDGEQIHLNYLEVYTQLPWMNTWEGAAEDEENYFVGTVEGEWPEWLQISGFTDEYWADGMYNLVQFKADALPEGVKGRQAKIAFASEKGAETKVITITQGEVEEEKESIIVDGEKVPLVETLTVNHEEVEKTAYSGKTESFDVNALVEALGISNISEAAQYIVNVTTGEAVANTTDGWRNAQGDAETWGSSAGMVCVKINDPASGVIDYIGCIDDTHVAGETYTAKWGFVANGKAAVVDVVINFVEKQEQEITRSLSENVIKARVEYETTEASYVEKKVELTDEQVSEILGDLQLESLDQAEVYGWNPTTEKLIADFETYDGWRDANGDFHNWSGNAEVPACVKYTDGKTYLCYNIAGCEPQEVKTYWAIANDTRAVLVEVTFAYVVPAGISELNADEQQEVIYNLNGVRMKNTQQKGVYIINGKKVVR